MPVCEEKIMENAPPQLNLGDPSDELLEWAAREIGESSNTRLQATAELRDMVYERGECEPHRMDDSFLLRFLRARNFCVPRAHRLLVNYCTFRKENVRLHEGVRPLDLAPTIGEDDIIAIPPDLDRDGRRLMIFRLGRWDPQRYDVDEIFKATLACLELGVLEQSAQILGGVCVFDLAGLSIAHARQVTPAVAMTVLQLISTAFPLRVNSVHVVRAPWPFQLVWRAFRPLLDKRMSDRLHLHGTELGTLHELLGADRLPQSLGGPRPDVSYKRWLLAMHDNDVILHEMRSLGYVVHQQHIDQFMSDNAPVVLLH